MYLIFDIGGTKMRLSVSRDLQTFSEPKVLPSPVSDAELLTVFAQTARELLGGEAPEAMCGGITAKHDGAKKGISQLFTCLVYLENDAALAALGEAHAGAGRGAQIMAYLTVSTGVGGARVVGGKLDEQTTNSEPGYNLVSVNGEEKTLEELVSGRSLGRRLGKLPKEVTDPAIWDELAGYLALGLSEIVTKWSPERVVLGGSMITGQPAIDLVVVERYFSDLARDLALKPEIKKAELGDFGGLHGALELLKQKLAKTGI